jgi:hypothetical protein
VAGTFPIAYSEELPSGRARAVTANLDVSTGSEAIARGAIALGSSIADIATTIYNQESAAEYSEKKRQADEKGNAFYNTATGDLRLNPETGEYEGADVELWQNFKKDLGTLQSKKPNVNAQLKKYINEISPDWQQAFYKHSLAIARQNAHDKFEFEGQNKLASGDLKGYYEQLHTRLALKDISQEKFNALTENAVVDSLLSQASRLSTSDNQDDRTRAEAILTNLPNVTDAEGNKYEISTEKLVYRNQLMKAIKQLSKQNSDEVEIDIITGMDENAQKPLTEKMVLAKQYISQLKQTDISGPRYEDLYYKIKNWENGNNGITNWSVYKEIFDMTIPVRNKEQSADAVWRKLFENQKNLSTSEFKSLKEEIEQAVKYTPSETAGPYVKTAVDTIKLFTKTADIDLSDKGTVLDIQKRINTLYQSSDKTPEQIESLTKQLLKPYKKKEAESKWEKYWPLFLPPGISIPIFIRRLIIDEPKNVAEYEKQLENYIVQGDKDAALKYEARWRSKFE